MEGRIGLADDGNRTLHRFVNGNPCQSVRVVRGPGPLLTQIPFVLREDPIYLSGDLPLFFPRHA